MGARKQYELSTRNITQNSSGTYSVTLPISVMRNLGWRKGQKVTVRQAGKKLVIEDWEK